MLFSEPKISQVFLFIPFQPTTNVSVLFSEPKISQFGVILDLRAAGDGFSALQRAENFSIQLGLVPPACVLSFSALQRAENFSIINLPHRPRCAGVSVLFSEPKISQSVPQPRAGRRVIGFSALQRAENFSTGSKRWIIARTVCFSALQRAENFSKIECCDAADDPTAFQCSSASRKFLKWVMMPRRVLEELVVSVLFSEPKISQTSGILAV